MAEELAREDVSVEIVALPEGEPALSEEALESVAKTSKVAVFHENGHVGGAAAEIAAAIAEQAFEHLDAPVRRVSAAQDDLSTALRDLAAY